MLSVSDYVGIRFWLNDQYIDSAVPFVNATRESAWRYREATQDCFPFLLKPLADLVVTYALEMNHQVFEKHILLKMIEFGFRVQEWQLHGEILFPYAWQMRFGYNLRAAGFQEIGFFRHSGPYDVEWYRGKPANHCFRPGCGSAGCRCNEPLTAEYLESHFRNGEYYFY